MEKVYCIFCCEEMPLHICAYWLFDEDGNSAHMYCLEEEYDKLEE